MADSHSSRQNGFRTVALILLGLGAVGSLYFMFKAGSDQKSILLLGLFTVWVLSPFAGLLFAYRLSKRWTEQMANRLYRAIILLTTASVIVYSRMFPLLPTPPAFPFLAIPFLSWLAIVSLLLLSRRHTQR